MESFEDQQKKIEELYREYKAEVEEMLQRDEDEIKVNIFEENDAIKLLRMKNALESVRNDKDYKKNTEKETQGKISRILSQVRQRQIKIKKSSGFAKGDRARLDRGKLPNR